MNQQEIEKTDPSFRWVEAAIADEIPGAILRRMVAGNDFRRVWVDAAYQGFQFEHTVMNGYCLHLVVADRFWELMAKLPVRPTLNQTTIELACSGALDRFASFYYSMARERGEPDASFRRRVLDRWREMHPDCDALGPNQVAGGTMTTELTQLQRAAIERAILVLRKQVQCTCYHCDDEPAAYECSGAPMCLECTAGWYCDDAEETAENVREWGGRYVEVDGLGRGWWGHDAKPYEALEIIGTINELRMLLGWQPEGFVPLEDLQTEKPR